MKFLKKPWLVPIVMQNHGLGWIIPDSVYLKCMFRENLGYKLDLKHPKTYNEKLQWLKLHNRKPEYSKMVDKYEAKKLVASIIGEKYIIPTLGVWERFEDIDFDALPERFVLKCTHDSGGLVICDDREKFDKDAAKKKIEKCLKTNYYWAGREWPYKNVKPRIIAEQYMEDETDTLQDYKVHSFNGIPKIVLAYRDKFSTIGLTDDFFTSDWVYLDFKKSTYGIAGETISQPRELNKMLELAKELSNNAPILRSDFYLINSKMYFGEITFSLTTDFDGFALGNFDKKMGEWIEIPGGGIIRTENWVLVIRIKKRSELTDYKIFCFDGEPYFIQVDFDRFSNHKRNLYSTRWECLPFSNNTMYPNDPNAKLEKPACLDEMLALSRKLSAGFPHLRTDFYYVDGCIYFGELTFFHGSGFAKFAPQSFDEKLGEKILLPSSPQK